MSLTCRAYVAVRVEYACVFMTGYLLSYLDSLNWVSDPPDWSTRWGIKNGFVLDALAKIWAGHSYIYNALPNLNQELAMRSFCIFDKVRTYLHTFFSFSFSLPVL